jgi:hypothetical protein
MVGDHASTTFGLHVSACLCDSTRTLVIIMRAHTCMVLICYIEFCRIEGALRLRDLRSCAFRTCMGRYSARICSHMVHEWRISAREQRRMRTQSGDTIVETGTRQLLAKVLGDWAAVCQNAVQQSIIKEGARGARCLRLLSQGLACWRALTASVNWRLRMTGALGGDDGRRHRALRTGVDHHVDGGMPATLQHMIEAQQMQRGVAFIWGRGMIRPHVARCIMSKANQHRLLRHAPGHTFQGKLHC